MTDHASVERVTTDQFRIPSSRKRGARVTYEHNTLLRVSAFADGAAYTGVGEGNPRLRLGTYDHDEGSWRFLTAASERLIGTTVGPRRTDVEAVMDDLRGLAASTASRQMRRRAHGLPYRGTLAGIDTALTDLAAKINRVPLVGLLGGERRSIQTATIVPPQAMWANLRTRLRSSIGSPVIKLAAVRRTDRALKLVNEVAEHGSEGVTLWLEMAGELAYPEAQELFETIDQLRLSGTRVSRVLVSFRAAGHDNLETLRRCTDRLSASNESSANFEVMADVATDAELDAALDSGVRAFHFTLQRAGGSLAVLRMAERLHAGAPDVRIGLSLVPHVSDLSVRAAAELASALPRLDYCALLTVGRKDVVESIPSLQFDEDHNLLPGNGLGLGAEPAVTPAVGHLRRFIQRPQRRWEAVTYHGRTPNTFDDALLLPLANPRGHIGINNNLLGRAALELGLNTSRSGQALLVSHEHLAEPLYFTPSRSTWTGVSGQEASDDKQITRQLLETSGVPIAQGAAFKPGELAQAVGYARSLKQPVVVKPLSGIHGKGVSVNLITAHEVRSAIELLADTPFATQSFIVETYIPGDDYRVLVVGDRAVSVVLKKPAEVVGDGHASVSELVLRKNRLRLANPHTRGVLIVIDQQAMNWLARQALTADSVPSAGQRVRLGSAGNIGIGGESIEVFDETHESILELAVRAVRAIPGLDYAGVDIMGDHQAGTEGRPAAVIEVNGNPALSFHHFPLAGTPRDVSSELVLRGCELADFDPGGARERLTVRIEIYGNIQGVGYRQWFAKLAHQLGVNGYVRNLPDGKVEATVSGPAYEVWAMSAAAFRGPQQGAVARVDTIHVTGTTPTQGFEVLE